MDTTPTTPTPGIPQTADAGLADHFGSSSPTPDVEPAQPPARKDGKAADEADDDWGVPPGKAEDVRDEGVLESLGEAVSAPVKGAAEPDEERLDPKQP